MMEKVRTEFTGPFGETMQLIQGMKNHVFLVDPEVKDEKGNPRTMMLTVEGMRDFLKELDNQ